MLSDALRKISGTLILLALWITGWSQGEVPELVTDRPVQTESSGVVPHHSLQVETGIVITGDRTDLSEFRSFAYNKDFIRV